MALDIKKEAKKVLDAFMKDPSLIGELSKDPVKTIEKITGYDLPDDEINQIISFVKAQTKNIDMDDIAGLLGTFAGTSTKKSTSSSKKTTAAAKSTKKTAAASTKKTTTTKKTTSTKKSTKSDGLDIDMEDIQKGAELIGKLLKK